VQQVGFRAYVLGQAELLGLSGETWNSLDGSVQVIAAHPQQAVLDELESALWNGPGKVENVRREPAPDPQPGFRITPTR